MTLSIRQIHPIFVGEVEGVDLRQPLDTETAAAIEAGMDEYAVLVFRDQDITDEQQAAFSRNFGNLERPGGKSNITKPDQVRLGPEMADISNLDRDNKVFDRDDRRRMFNLGNRLWHSDSSFRAIPAKFSLLSARIIPSKGGETQFADMRAAYDALDDETKERIDDLICEHSLIYSRGLLGFDELSEDERANFKPVLQRLVRTHPVTGRKSLYLSSHAGTIVGWPMPEARCFLRDLIEEATQPEMVYTHEWRRHDLVIWDNRQTMHRARRFNDTEEVRDMRRTTVAGEEPTVSQA
ncbi:MAG: TauD/TfdA family dioxygenase, partial [Alphaproteobacteria bacterium]|nr:TauD/TfdA family dioxygenase [Alphaproteobacteria bacterium]